ncbi:hypothetical protein EPI10_031383 [Gossypium australe]|uniref:Uncharacterized protein n=1 Tax=Gossypium australe TaxID=47621 RepID=A0A5B6X3V9_9ROSI|nr:hypothetical protein EPI10_031383 [Gossypium australe]
MTLLIFEKTWVRGSINYSIKITIVHHKRVLKYVLVKGRSFIILADFVVLDFEEDCGILILIGTPF